MVTVLEPEEELHIAELAREPIPEDRELQAEAETTAAKQVRDIVVEAEETVKAVHTEEQDPQLPEARVVEADFITAAVRVPDTAQQEMDRVEVAPVSTSEETGAPIVPAMEVTVIVLEEAEEAAEGHMGQRTCLPYS